MLHLISFENIEEKRSLIESQWLLKWFLDIRDVNESSVGLWRETWITIYGVPIVAWNYENFMNIGSVYGQVRSVEYSRMDYAKILIITDCFFHINNPLLLEIREKHFKIFVVEDSKSCIVQDSPKLPNNIELKSQSDEELDPTKNSKEKNQVPAMAEAPGTSKVTETPSFQPVSEGTAFNLGNDENWPFNEKLEVSNKKFSSPSLKTKEPQSHLFYHKTQTNQPSNVGSPIMVDTQKVHQISPSPTSLERIKISKNSPELSLTRNFKSPKQSPSPQQSSYDPHMSSRLKPIRLFSQSPSPKSKRPCPLGLSQLNIGPPPQLRSNPPISASGETNQISSNPIPQIPITNSFSPLQQKNQIKKQLPNPASSSSFSDPPPGFEDFIPPPLKFRIEQKKLRKQKKREEKKKKVSSTPIHKSHPLSPKEIHSYAASEIIDLGLKLGMSFKGPLSDLHTMITEILAKQEDDWVTNL